MKSPGIRVIGRVLKPLVHVLLLIPLGLLIFGFFTQALGPNPVETLTHTTGERGLQILLLSLTVTPLARLTNNGWLIHFRRLIGLYSFFYILLHFTNYLLLDLSFDFGGLLDDIIKRPYITVGFSSFIILIALTITSPLNIRRKMGYYWQKLHRLVYAAAALGILHFLWSTKADDREPMIYAIVFALLMAYRIGRTIRRKTTIKP